MTSDLVIYNASGGLTTSSVSEIDQAQYFGMRMKQLQRVNPWMSDNPQALATLAGSPLDTSTLIAHGAAMYGMQAGDTVRSSLERMSAGSQRSVFNTLSSAQQMALQQQGYKPPSDEEQSVWGVGIGAKMAMDAAGFVWDWTAGLIPKVAQLPVIHQGLDMLQWVADQPAHLYRTVRMRDDGSQALGLIGGLIAAGAALAAIPTGGLSLAALGTVVGSGLLGAAAGSAVTNPMDWGRTWVATMNGETTFDRPSLRRVDEILGDPRLVNLARDTANNLPADLSIVDVAKEVAGQRDVGIGSQFNRLGGIAKKYAPEGSGQYQKILQGLATLIQQPEFQDAVNTLQRGKISMGRDVADQIGLDPSSGFYSFASGAIDGALLFATDPLILATNYVHALSAAERGIDIVKGADNVGNQAIDRFLQLSRDNAGVRRMHEAIADAVTKGDYNLIRRYAPNMQDTWQQLIEYRNMIGADSLARPFTVNDFREWMITDQKLQPLLQGFAAERGRGQMVLSQMTKSNEMWRNLAGNIRSFTYGLTDARMETAILDTIRQGGTRALYRLIPEQIMVNLLDAAAEGDARFLSRNIADVEQRFAELDFATQSSLRGFAQRMGHATVYDTIDSNYSQWTQDLADLLPQGDQITEDVLRNFALKNEHFIRARQWGRAAGKYGGGAAGELITGMTTMVPKKGFLRLSGQGAAEDIRNFMELGVFADIPQWVRREYTNQLLQQRSVGMRMTAVQSFMDTMMTNVGMRLTPEGDRLANELMLRVHQNYAAGGLDTFVLNERTARQGIFLSEMADAIPIPNLTELRKAVKGGYIAGMIGYADLPLLEQFQARVWKPSVLLRLGFIPRAAGEEFLNYLFRGGFGGTVQELAARSIAREEAYYAVRNNVDQGNVALTDLTAGERHLLNEGAMPYGLRGLTRKMQQFNWTSPVIDTVEKWTSFARHIWTSGQNQRFLEERYNRLMSNVAGSDFHLYNLADNASEYQQTQARIFAGRYNLRANLKSPDALRYTLAENLDSIMFGSQKSWRRMIVGGIHDDVLDAAEKWYERHASTIMRSVGASHAGPYDRTISPNQRVSMDVVDRSTGKIREHEVFMPRGHRQLLHSDDNFFHNGVQAQMVRPIDDILGSEVAARYAIRIKPPTVNEVDVTRMSVGTELAQQSSVAEAIASEYLTITPRWDRIENMIDRVSARFPALRELRAHLSEGDHSFTTLMDSLNFIRQSTNDPAVLLSIDNLVTDLTPFADAHRIIEATYSANDAAWIYAHAAHGDIPYAQGPFTAGTTSGTAFYNNFDEMAIDARQFLINAYANPSTWAGQLTPVAGGEASGLGLTHMQGIEDTAAIGKGLKARTDTGLFSENRLPFYVPVTSSTVAPQTFDDLAALAADRHYLDVNRSVVEAWLDIHKTGNVGMLADQRLADEISRAFNKGGTDIRALVNYQSPAMLKAENIPGIRQVDTGAQGADEVRQLGNALWEADGGMWAGGAFGPIHNPDSRINQVYEDQADTMLAYMRSVWTGGNREYLVPRMRRLDNGTLEPTVFRYDATNNLIPVDPSEHIFSPEHFVDHAGRVIKFGDNLYFDRVLIPGNGDMMWDAVAPIFMDGLDERKAAMLFGQKHPPQTVGKPLGPTGTVRLYRSRVSDIVNANDVIPNLTIGEIYQIVPQNKWDLFVRNTFDKVFGPAIDALARRPMAFHFFAERYAQGKALRQWLVDADLMDRVNNLGSRLAQINNSDPLDIAQISDYGRTVGKFVTDTPASVPWNNTRSLAWLRGHTEQEFAQMLVDAEQKMAFELARGNRTVQESQDLNHAVTQLRARNPRDVINTLPADIDPQDVLAYIRSQFPNETIPADPLRDPIVTGRGTTTGLPHSTLRHLNQDEWNTVLKAQNHLGAVVQDAADAAAVAAINDMLPFIDSHEFKTQFAEYLKGFMPFWYAEENFMKRWARTLIDQGPAVIAKAQLTYMGLKTAGIVRTDPNGRQYFVYPGSNLLQEAINKIPGMPDLPLGTLLQSPTDMMLPGINSRFGSPQLGPLVSVPLKLVEAVLPETRFGARRMIGDLGASKTWWEQLVPAPLVNTFDAITADESDQRMSSAMLSAIAHLEANGDGLPDNATPGEVDRFLDKVRNHARIIVFSQALGGWFAPGPLQVTTVGRETGPLALGKQDPAKVLSDLYVNVVRQLGIEKGTQEFLKLYPMADMTDVVNPLAFTVAANESVSGARLPSTDNALAFYDANEAMMKEFPFAGPWLLPSDPNVKEQHSQYAYDQQTVNGLRRRRTPEEFLQQMKFKLGANEYFTTKQQFQDRIEAARVANNVRDLQEAKLEMDDWATAFRIAHPLFTQELESSASRERRGQVISEMRVLMNDPQVPQTDALNDIRLLINTYDQYIASKAELSLDNSFKGRVAVESLKGRFENYMNDLVVGKPAVQSFWLSVLRPESGLN